ncbi:MAG: triose-phosphate isomerase [Actinobacteria bacterium]|nr:triose-phosphate isomerase [Actinomycetota bacterium]MCG2808349.1 triose-phosphate isomerase [Coriobacteriia bacterium]
MGRRPMIAGNWKMYKTSGQSAILIQNLDERVESMWDRVEVVVCPPFTSLKAASTVIELDRLQMGLGAQDVHWEPEGAFTGEVSVPMLKELRCDYCIVGHSERREMFGETNETVNKKTRALLAADIVPIVCCGETLAIREAEQTDAWVRDQVRAGLDGISPKDAARIVVAYEPIWAIGTGRTPTPEQANDVARGIRATIGAMFGPEAAMTARVLYGGSVKPENALMFMVEPDIDGALVGGAALDAVSFAEIVAASL